MKEYVLRRDPETYNAKRIALEVEHFKIPNLLAVLPENFAYRSVAEIGCATGELIGTFPRTDIQLQIGFDISPLNIHAAQQRFPWVTFRGGDFRSCTDEYDLVILSDILEHVPDDVDFLRAAAGMGKMVLVNLPLERCLMNSFRKYGPNDPSGHLRSYTLADGLRLFEQAGLSVINYTQRWSFESKYELLRQELNERMLGARFSGSLLTQMIKAAIFRFFMHFRGLGRRCFSSNLFAAAKRMPHSR